MIGKNKSTKKKRKSPAAVCVVCEGNKKPRGQKKCCGPKLTSSDKGTWNA